MEDEAVKEIIPTEESRAIVLLRQLVAEVQKLNAKHEEMHGDLHHELREIKIRLNDGLK